MGLGKPFEQTISDKIRVTGVARLCCNAFTAMPKGSFSLTVEEMTSIVREADSSTMEHKVLTKVEGLVLRISRQISLDGDRLVYRLSEHEFKKKQVIDFDSYYFDDAVKIQIYQKNSTAKINQVGKITLHLSDLVFENLDDADEEFYPVTLKCKRTLL